MGAIASALALAITAVFGTTPAYANDFYIRDIVMFSPEVKIVSMRVGDTQSIAYNVTPVSVDETEGCGMPECPTICGEKDCLDDEGNCLCAGSDKTTYVTTVTAKSTDTSVATATINNGNVVVAAVGPGTATINLTGTLREYEDGGAKITVTVAKPLESGAVSLATTEGEITVGDSTTVAITENLSEGTLSAVSNDDAVAKAEIADGALKITSVAPGEATITVTSAANGDYEAASAEYHVTVNEALPSISISGYQSLYHLTYNAGGSNSSKDYTLTIDPSDAKVSAKATNTNVVSAVYFNKKLTMTAKGQGTTKVTITATKDGYETTVATFTVYVTSSAHVHNPAITRTSDGSVSAVCTASYCGYSTGPDQTNISLGTGTIMASDATYDGSAHGATVVYGTLFQAGVMNKVAPEKCPTTYTAADGTVLDGAPILPGTYTASATLGTETVFVTYTIAPLDGSVMLASTEGSVYEGASATVDVSENVSGGVLSAQSSDESVATATVSDGKFVVTGVKAGTATITVTSAAEGGYTEATATYTVTVNKLQANTASLAKTFIKVDKGNTQANYAIKISGLPAGAKVTVAAADKTVVSAYKLGSEIKFAGKGEGETTVTVAVAAEGYETATFTVNVFAVDSSTHVHDWTFVRNSDASVSATCSDYYCTFKGTPDATVNIGPAYIKASDATYDGFTHSATVVYGTQFQNGVAGGILPENCGIAYSAADGTVLDGAPTMPGTYTASAVVAGQTVKTSYTIASIDDDAPVISGIEPGNAYKPGTIISIEDASEFTVAINGEAVEVTDGTVTLPDITGTAAIVATDFFGNETTVVVSVHPLGLKETATTDEDGNTTTTTETNEGQTISVITTDPEGDVLVSTLFDEDGSSVTTTYNEDGSVLVTEKASDGTVTNEVLTRADGKTVITGFEHAFLNGENQTYAGEGDLTVRTNDILSNFVTVRVDGDELDAESYETASGSTIVTLKEAYLKTLDSGVHELAVESSNGIAKTNFTVAAPATDDSEKVTEPDGNTTETPTSSDASEPGKVSGSDAKNTGQANTEKEAVAETKTQAAKPTTVAAKTVAATASTVAATPKTADPTVAASLLAATGIALAGMGASLNLKKRS
jgi:hypothetical protein